MAMTRVSTNMLNQQLTNVDNTSDATKNAAVATLTNKTLTSPAITTPTGIAKADVGLGNVDNTSDATKNAATATLTNKTLTSPVINTPTGITKADVGLGNVDNTSDATQNAATATLTNKTLTAPVISSIVNTGTLTLPTSTDTVVARATSDTLTNKTISGVSNTITNVSLTAGVTGTLPTANGGTNAITANAGLNNLLPTQTSNASKYLTTDGTNTSWGSVAGGGAKNFVVGGDAELGTTGWTVDSFAATARPAGALTGVATGVTFTTSSTAPLADTNSFLFAKDAVNRQGRVVYTGLTITPAYQAKVLQVSADYLVSSGTFVAGSSGVDSDVIFYLWDVTNSTFIEPSSFKLLSNSTTIADKFQATFQTSATGTSYRLLMYVASTSALAYTLKIDNIAVSPSVYVFGTPITDWAAYTPTFAGFGTPTSVTYYWRRAGDTAEIRGSFIPGTLSAAEARASLPSGLTSADSTKLPALSVVGSGATQRTIPDVLQILAEPSVTYLTFAPANGSIPGYTKALGNNFAAVAISYFAQVPILGWSSSVQISDQADTRLVDLVAQSAGGQALTANATNMTFSIINKDSHGVFDGTTYKIPVAGDYPISLGQQFTSAVSAVISAYVNGTLSTHISYATSSVISTGSAIIPNLKTGDLLTFRSDTAATTTSNNFKLSISRISGPSAIAASESVNAKYNTTVFSGAAGIVILTNKLFDSHGSYNTTTGVYTVPISGLYEVGGLIQAAGTSFSVGGNFEVYASVNGSAANAQYIMGGSRAETTQAVNRYASGSTLVRAVAGDTISLYQSSSTSTAPVTAVFNIKKVGN